MPVPSLQEQLRRLYPRLKVLALGARPEATLHTYFPSFLSRATPSCPPAMRKEVSGGRGGGRGGCAAGAALPRGPRGWEQALGHGASRGSLRAAGCRAPSSSSPP